MTRKVVLVLLAALFGIGLPLCEAAWAGDGAVVREIKRRGAVRCGVGSAPGLSARDVSGRPIGMMVDMCRALAAAVLGNPDAIEVRRLERFQEFNAIATGEVDVSFASSSLTLSRSADLSVAFGPVIYYDGQAIAARRGDARVAADIRDATVCVADNTTSVINVADYIRAHGRQWKVRTYPTWDEALQGFLSQDCALIASDRLVLAASLLSVPEIRGQVILFDDVLSREPIAPVLPASDGKWQIVVRWVMFALFLADDKGVTAANVAIRRQDPDSEIQRMLAGVPGVPPLLGLPDSWAYDVIAGVGNYGEIFDRNIGQGSSLGMGRGVNRPWTQGGLLYAFVFQ